MIKEVFKKDCIRIYPKKALLLLFNGIKSKMLVPSFMNGSNITTIYKNKGSRIDPENDRGVFIITVLNKIMDRLGYNDNYDYLDVNMSYSNIEALLKLLMPYGWTIASTIFSTKPVKRTEMTSLHFYLNPVRITKL